MSKPPSKMERLIAGITLFIAFLVMASIFAPAKSQAHESTPAAAPPVHESEETHESAEPSADPHEGLRSMGSLDSSGYRVEIFAGGQGPRYSIVDHRDDEIVGTLLSAAQVERYFPGLTLPAMDFSADGPELLMLAD